MHVRHISLVIAATLAASAALSQQAVPGGHFIENWDADSDGAVTLAETETKRADLFRMFDMDGNDSLDAEEYRLFDETRRADMDANAGGAGKGPMKRVEDGLTFGYNDIDGDGAVSSSEFVGRSSDWFAGFDADADGRITPADFGPRR